MESTGLKRWSTTFCLMAVLLPVSLISSCHARSRQAATQTKPPTKKQVKAEKKAREAEIIGEQQSEHPVEPTPSADQVAPSSPDAVLDGTSTTAPAAQTAPEVSPKPHR